MEQNFQYDIACYNNTTFILSLIQGRRKGGYSLYAAIATSNG